MINDVWDLPRYSLGGMGEEEVQMKSDQHELKLGGEYWEGHYATFNMLVISYNERLKQIPRDAAL